ncbi:MAG: asparaginase [Clostridia bacterium]|nr:asparaginase [Clostridia bacterium]
MSEILVEVTRSGIVESIHRGNIAVVDTTGKLLGSVGDPERITFFRSSAKPIIATAVLESGIVEKFKLDLKEVAIMASSHSGGKEHVAVLESIMDKTGISRSLLACGIKEPTGQEAAKELIAEGIEPNELHCNCSGKHLGVIAATKEKGLPDKDYHKYEHEIQKQIEKVVSDFTTMKSENIVKGIDGCGIPVYGIPLKNMALAYANLCNENFLDGKYKKSQNYVVSAMTLYPEMVAGKGRFDTELMKRFGDRLIAKFGAEGVHCLGLIGKGIGMAVKIEDGNSRGVNPAVLEALLQLNVLDRKEVDEAVEIKELWRPKVKNNRDEIVGEMRAVFQIQ